MKSSIKNCANIILFLFLLLPHYKCNTNRQESPIPENLLLQKLTPFKIPEPSALAFSYDSSFFWSVSDSNSKVYKLDKQGNIIKTFMVTGEDLEGIAVIDSVHLAVILEKTGEVVVLDTSGKEIKGKKLNLNGKQNEGIEGICFDVYSHDFYFVKEKNPGLLIKTDSNFTELFRKEIKFAKDYSDIYFVKEDSSLWILSDESKMIIKTDKNGNKLKSYTIKVEQPEGLVVDYKNKKVYVVSDIKNELYEFILP